MIRLPVSSNLVRTEVLIGAQTVDDLTRVIEHIAYSRPFADELPGGSTVPRHRTWPDAVRPLSHGAARPDEPPTRQIRRRHATANRR
jgi:hypothetical protein